MSLVVDVKLSASSLHWKEIIEMKTTLCKEYVVCAFFLKLLTFFGMKITISLM